MYVVRTLGADHPTRTLTQMPNLSVSVGRSPSAGLPRARAASLVAIMLSCAMVPGLIAPPHASAAVVTATLVRTVLLSDFGAAKPRSVGARVGSRRGTIRDLGLRGR